MSKKWIQPKLVMGYLEVVSGDDMQAGIPYDEAVIHLEGDEDSEIEVRCPGALRFAPIIVSAVNNHQILVDKLGKVAKWLERLAIAAERGAQNCRYESLREAYIADAKNYRKTIADILPVLEAASYSPQEGAVPHD